MMQPQLAQINFPALFGEQKISPGIITIGPGLNIATIITQLLPFAFYGAGLILLLYLVYGGIQMMLSRGDPKGVQAAQGIITSALVGFVIIFAAFWIVKIIGIILGIEVFSNIFGL